MAEFLFGKLESSGEVFTLRLTLEEANVASICKRVKEDISMEVVLMDARMSEIRDTEGTRGNCQYDSDAAFQKISLIQVF
jgi:hypothetical protein